MAKWVGMIFGSALTLLAFFGTVGLPKFEPVEQIADRVAAEPASAVVDEQPVVSDRPSQALPPPAEAVDAFEEVARAATVQAPVDELHWYAFWTPFRSEIAATGFMQQLQRTTGIDYRVVRQSPGAYEVAFAYASEAEIDVNLEAIQAATGLTLPDG